MAEIQVEVTKFSVQYILKDEQTDMPKILPPSQFAVDLDVEAMDELVPYLPIYTEALLKQAIADPDDPERKTVPQYGAPAELVGKWKKKLKKKYPGSFAGKIDADVYIDAAISCTIEDNIKDALEELWDGMAEELNAVPEPPPGFRVGGRYIHLLEWKVK